MINFNFIHDSGHCKEAAYVSDQPGERLELNLSYLAGYRTRPQLKPVLHWFTGNM